MFILNIKKTFTVVEKYFKGNLLKCLLSKTIIYHNRNVVKLCKYLTFCRMFFKTETNETLDSSIKTMFIKVKKGTKHPEAYS